jgi:hypothetical protein
LLTGALDAEPSRAVPPHPAPRSCL